MPSVCVASNCSANSRRERRPIDSTRAAAASSPSAWPPRPTAPATAPMPEVDSRPTGRSMLSDSSTTSATTGFCTIRSSSRRYGPASTNTSSPRTPIRQRSRARRNRGASQGSRCSWRRLIHHPSGTRSKSPPHQTHGRAQCHSTASIREASSWPTPAARARRARRSFIGGCPGRGYGSRCRSPPDRPPARAPASLRGADHGPVAGASGSPPAGRHQCPAGRPP